MIATSVAGPDGRRWRVGRQWRGWRPRMRDTSSDGNPTGWGDVGADTADDVAGFLIALAIGVLVVALIVLLSPLFGLVLLAFEWAIALFLIPVAVLGRVLLRRPWTVYAERAEDDRRYVARVPGWRASGRAITAAVEEIRQYGEPRSLTRSPG